MRGNYQRFKGIRTTAEVQLGTHSCDKTRSAASSALNRKVSHPYYPIVQVERDQAKQLIVLYKRPARDCILPSAWSKNSSRGCSSKWEGLEALFLRACALRVQRHMSHMHIGRSFSEKALHRRLGIPESAPSQKMLPR
jgi:hypothetical protein